MVEIIRNLRDPRQVQFIEDTINATTIKITLTDAEIEQAYTEFLNQKFIRDTKYFLEENYNGDPDAETIDSIAEDYKEALGSKIDTIENEVFDDVMERNYPEYERNW